MWIYFARIRSILADSPGRAWGLWSDPIIKAVTKETGLNLTTWYVDRFKMKECPRAKFLTEGPFNGLLANRLQNGWQLLH